MFRILDFDIDGVILDYDDRPRSAFLDGPLESVLEACRFDVLYCVSGWAAIVRHAN